MSEQFSLAIKALSISMKSLLTKEECAAMLAISTTALDKRIGKRELPFYRSGGHVYFNREDVEAEILSPRNRVESTGEREVQQVRSVTRMAEKARKRNRNLGGIAV